MARLDISSESMNESRVEDAEGAVGGGGAEWAGGASRTGLDVLNVFSLSTNESGVAGTGGAEGGIGAGCVSGAGGASGAIGASRTGLDRL